MNVFERFSEFFRSQQSSVSEAREVALIGLGSQGQAWALNLLDSGWTVKAYVRLGASRLAAEELARIAKAGDAFQIRDIDRLKSDTDLPHLVAMTSSDPAIGELYDTYLSARKEPLEIVVLHGMAVHTRQLKIARAHTVSLLAPKAIGPKLRSEYEEMRKARRKHHGLKAAVFPGAADDRALRALAFGLGFTSSNLIPADFKTETLADWLSEQTLLCGGVFPLLAWTMQTLRKRGVPERLIREECISELELIASLIRERGPEVAFSKISQLAKAGASVFAHELERLGVKSAIEAQWNALESGAFEKQLATQTWRDWASRLEDDLHTAEHGEGSLGRPVGRKSGLTVVAPVPSEKVERSPR
jgi:ketol-acid reductoisomerase